MNSDVLHYSVLPREVLEYLGPALKNAENDQKNNPPLLIDGTLGEGGHSEIFLKEFPRLHVIGLDRDREIIKRAEKRLEPYSSRFTAVNVWFDDFFAAPGSDPDPAPGSDPDPDRFGAAKAPDAVLFDFGISTYHYALSGRGFSFSKDEPLDMRLDHDCSINAEYIVNTYDQDRLADVIYQYGEERYSRRIAAAIAKRRKMKAVSTSADLADIIKGSVPRNYRYGRIHPATRTFQALRIEVNGELDRIDRVLENAVNSLSPGGRIGIISFHSLEDRRVKQMLRKLAVGCVCPPDAPQCVCGGYPQVKLVTKKPVRPAEDEVLENPASRSARFRCAEKLPADNGGNDEK
jgi:16S rRNA (cytosine1402-N4)-methyltransferase